MEPRLNIVTLGVENLEKAVHFYKDCLGWTLSSISGGDFAIFKLSTGTALALYPRHLLAKDACVEDFGGFGGITLAQNVLSKEEVDRALSQAVLAGAMLLKRQVIRVGRIFRIFRRSRRPPWEVEWSPLLELQQGKLVLTD